MGLENEIVLRARIDQLQEAIRFARELEATLRSAASYSGNMDADRQADRARAFAEGQGQLLAGEKDALQKLKAFQRAAKTEESISHANLGYDPVTGEYRNRLFAGLKDMGSLGLGEDAKDRRFTSTRGIVFALRRSAESFRSGDVGNLLEVGALAGGFGLLPEALVNPLVAAIVGTKEIAAILEEKAKLAVELRFEPLKAEIERRLMETLDARLKTDPWFQADLGEAARRNIEDDQAATTDGWSRDRDFADLGFGG